MTRSEITSFINDKYIQKKFITPYSGKSCETDLLQSVTNGDLLLTFKLLVQGGNINFTYDLDNSRTLLHIATDNRDWIMMLFLLLNGADPAIPDQDGRNVLHLAAIDSSSESCALLLKNGAKENQIDLQGKTPFTYAMESKNGDCITLLRLAQLSQSGRSSSRPPMVPEIKLSHPESHILNSELLPESTGLDSIRKSASNLMDKYTHLLMEKSLSQYRPITRQSNDNQVVEIMLDNIKEKEMEGSNEESLYNKVKEKRERGRRSVSKPRNPKDMKRLSMDERERKYKN
jgi:hypothetical protein